MFRLAFRRVFCEAFDPKIDTYKFNFSERYSHRLREICSKYVNKSDNIKTAYHKYANGQSLLSIVQEVYKTEGWEFHSDHSEPLRDLFCYGEESFLKWIGLNLNRGDSTYYRNKSIRENIRSITHANSKDVKEHCSAYLINKFDGDNLTTHQVAFKVAEYLIKVKENDSFNFVKSQMIHHYKDSPIPF